ncbi:hypothetical protein BJX63DRAFT_201728 [Aspergillus granulosus]|uniref:Uncharacterized protein n=1 Tax=Aspergillus granulosus TaxID=176169 RepID=A0ABR4HG40_9EURO
MVLEWDTASVVGLRLGHLKEYPAGSIRSQVTVMTNLRAISRCLISLLPSERPGRVVGFSGLLAGRSPWSRTSLSPFTPRLFPSPWLRKQVTLQHLLSNPWPECIEAPCQDGRQLRCSSRFVMMAIASRNLTVPQQSQPLFCSRQAIQVSVGLAVEAAFILSIRHDDQSMSLSGVTVRRSACMPPQCPNRG